MRRVCLCVLCGLPAAGKSRLAEELRGRARSRGWETLLMTYDELIPARDWSEDEWKQQRKMVLSCLERFLQQTHTENAHTNEKHTENTHTEHTHTNEKHTHTNETHTEHTHTDETHTEHTHTDEAHTHNMWLQIHRQVQHTHSHSLLVLLDDNFYYQSMRYQIYQLARKYSTGFCQVFVCCALEVCLQRNRLRSPRVPQEVLLLMAERMEAPNQSRNSWEQQSVTVDNTHGDTREDENKLMDLLESALGNPLSSFQDDSQQKDADRQICASNVLHRADHMSRRLVSQAMTSAHGLRASSDVLKVLAKELNALKTRFLQELKKEILHEVSLEPTSTEELLMAAVGAFEQETQHCVQTQIKHTFS